jgi:hypothetical protein
MPAGSAPTGSIQAKRHGEGRRGYPRRSRAGRAGRRAERGVVVRAEKTEAKMRSEEQ